MSRVTAQYDARVARGTLAPDTAQAAAAARLGQLAEALTAAKPRLFGKPGPVRGLYLWGGVGRGKSMLLDLFFDCADVSPKRRVHFHAFMTEVHDRLDAWRTMGEAARRRSPDRVKGAGDDPIRPVAHAIAKGARLLCFDEFQVTQIADAMILGRLFDALFAEGVTVVATSNRHPDDLYTDGINRQLFLPFITRLKEACDVVELAAARDYRLGQLTEAPVWYTPLNAASAAALDSAWTRLTLGAAPRAFDLALKGRKLHVPCTAAGVARFSFEALCARPLGAADYLAVAANFHTLILEGVPILTPDRRNEAARFVTLIDAIYEARTKLVASAAAGPDTLYPAGDGAFEFQRTASRLHEMAASAYLAEERKATGDV